MGTKRIFELSTEATENDLDLGYFFALDKNGMPTAKLPSACVAKRSVQNKIIESIAPLFDKDKVGGYNAKDCVMYSDGGLYIFNSVHPQGQPWTGSDVSPIDVKTLTSDPAFIQTVVEQWLQEHPEATTTVQDGSIGIEKLTTSAKIKLQNPFVTPEEFGAYGDGVHDDSTAIQNAINAVAGHKETYLLFTAEQYLVSQNIIIPGHTSVVGSNKNKIYLSNGASFVIGTSDDRTYEVRISGLSIFGQEQTEYCIRNYSENAIVSQCFFTNLYLDHATVAAIRLRGSILYIDKVSCYYSHIGAKLKGNAIYVANCNFWDNEITLFLDTTFAKFTNDWFEGGTGTKGTNNVQIVHESACQAFFEGCAFQGSNATTQKVLNDSGNNANKSGSFFFIQCRINYPGATGGIFKIVITAPNQMRLRFLQCYIYAPGEDYIIDNSEADISMFCFQANSCGGLGRPMCSNETTRAISMDVEQDWRGVPYLRSGIVIGTKKPVVDAVINDQYEGYLRYDDYAHKLQLQSNGEQKYIPLRAGTKVSKLNADATQSDIINTVNNLLQVLGNESGTIPAYS